MPDQQTTRVSRRSFYKLGAGWMACAASGAAEQNPGGAATLDRLPLGLRTGSRGS